MVNKNKLLVLGVAINNYAQTRHNLEGCHNDLNDVVHFLESYIDEEEWILEIKTLKDQQATRQQLIDTFITFFQQLNSGDTALFYFSGHGSQAYAPSVFLHELPGGMHETIVCYDSRTTSTDLYDKELSYLIWKVTNRKQVNFIVIMDCCHSGSATRMLNEQNTNIEERTRRRSPGKIKRNWKDYVGASEYYQSSSTVNVPISKHILIAACNRTEKAKERSLDFKPRGIFTYALLKALRQSGGEITYDLLIQKVQAIVSNFTINQNPRLEYYGEHETGIQYFLDQSKKGKQEIGLVYYDFNKQLWVFNQGAINGVLKSQRHISTIKIYPEKGADGQINLGKYEELSIVKVHTSYTIVNMLDIVNRAKQFPAIINQKGRNRMKVWICEPKEDKEIYEVTMMIKDYTSGAFDWCLSKAAADYFVRVDKTIYTIQKVNSTEGSFNEIPWNNSERNIEGLIAYLEFIAKWYQVKGITNPDSGITSQELKCSFFRVNKSMDNGLSMIEEKEIEDFLVQPVELQYAYNEKNAKWEEPAFRLKLEAPKENARVLWISALFLDADYNITNELCPSEVLQPGESHWLGVVNPFTGFYTTVISLCLPKKYIERGVCTVTEHFKLFVATEEFNTKILQQNNSMLNNYSGQQNRGLYFMKELEQLEYSNWTVIDFSIKLVKPFT